jgi:hypothetical protein
MSSFLYHIVQDDVFQIEIYVIPRHAVSSSVFLLTLVRHPRLQPLLTHQGGQEQYVPVEMSDHLKRFAFLHFHLREIFFKFRFGVCLHSGAFADGFLQFGDKVPGKIDFSNEAQCSPGGPALLGIDDDTLSQFRDDGNERLSFSKKKWFHKSLLHACSGPAADDESDLVSRRARLLAAR